MQTENCVEKLILSRLNSLCALRISLQVAFGFQVVAFLAVNLKAFSMQEWEVVLPLFRCCTGSDDRFPEIYGDASHGPEAAAAIS